MKFYSQNRMSYGKAIMTLALLASVFCPLSVQAVQVGAPAFLETASPTEQLYVDVRHQFASDQNPGTSDLPFRTIEKAVYVAKLHRKNGLSTRIVIKPGTYRESIDLIVPSEAPDSTQAPVIMIEGTVAGKVVISGSDIWSKWEPTESSHVFMHAWPYQWGEAQFPETWPSRLDSGPVLLRREMVFMNRMPLKQVFSKHDLGRGTFYVSETEKKIYLSPRQGMTLDGSIVEVAVRPTLLAVNGLSNLVLRRMVFEHASTPIQKSAATFTGVRNLLFEDCWFRWNNWTGFQLFRVQHVTGRRNAANYNGGAGMIGTQIRSFLSEEQLTAYNNWRGARGGLFFWGVAGAKYLGVHEAVIRRQRAISNHAGGLWFDTDNEDVLIEQSRWCGNLQYGLFIEASQGPIKVQNSRIYHNEWAGLHLMTSENVALDNNEILNNAGAAISVARRTKRTIQNWETLQHINLETGHWTILRNVFSGNNLLLVLRAESFVDTLMSDQNLWMRPHKDIGFLVRKQAANQVFNFVEWQQNFQHDGQSAFQHALRSTKNTVPDCSYEMVPYWIGLESLGDVVTNRSHSRITVD